MHFLIDGHNLIAKMPGISLSDPDDEAQLILRLRSWVAASRKRRVTVYFDGGLPGGREPHLSGARLEVVFASGGRPADDMLIRHIQRVKNPPEYTLVSSDRAVIAAAEKRRMPFLLAQDFAPELAAESPPPVAPPPSPATDKPVLSEAEVAAWMELFGPEPELPKQPVGRHRRRRRPEEVGPEAQPEAEPEPPAPRDPAELKDSGEPLTPEEVALWLDAFADAPQPPAEEPQPAPEPGQPPARRRRQRQQPRGEGRPADALKASGAALSADEVEEWLDLFRSRDDQS